jgi:O-antigen/teichoic acid export membrane protein
MGVFLITNILTRDIDKLVISKMGGTEQLAVYTNCGKALPFDIVSTAIVTVLVPYIMKYVSNKNFDKVKSLYSCYLRIGYYSTWIFGCGCIIVSTQIISFLYSAEYLSGNVVFIAYIIDSMIRFAGMHLILTGNGDSKILMVYSVISLALNAVLNIVFYYFIGFNGPAFATVIVAVLYVAMIMRKSMEIINTSITDIIDFKELSIFVAELLATGACAYFINKFLLSLGMHQNISMIITLAVFGLANFTLNYRHIKDTLGQLNSYKIEL